MVLELTLVRLGLSFDWSLDGMFLQVIWAIGLSMVLLASPRGLRRAVAVGRAPSGAVIVLGHNVLDLAAGPSGPPGREAPRRDAVVAGPAPARAGPPGPGDHLVLRLSGLALVRHHGAGLCLRRGAGPRPDSRKCA